MFFRASCIFLSLVLAVPFSYGSNLIDFRQNLSVRIANELVNHSIPGAAYVVVQNNNVIALETFGHTDKAKSQKINNNTVFRLASVSKTFAATITTMLAQEQSKKMYLTSY